MEETKVQTQGTNDSVLSSIGDNYLARKKRNRKIVFSIISFLSLALAVAIIVLSSVKINTKPVFIDNAASYTINVNGREVYYGNTGNTAEEFKEFDKLFDEAFSYNYLTALFSGKLEGYELTSENETGKEFFSKSNANKPSGEVEKYLSNDYVRIDLAKQQQVKYHDGKVYKSRFNSKQDLKFSVVYFSLSDVDEEGEITFCLATYRGESTTATITTITVEANTYALYEFATKN